MCQSGQHTQMTAVHLAALVHNGDGCVYEAAHARCADPVQRAEVPVHIDTQPFLLSDAFMCGSHCGGLYQVTKVVWKVEQGRTWGSTLAGQRRL